ncbi:hypothetical protein X943_000617 [Babesia divergens]|uniref:Uncharacterized protein n=1 Tax=Babesia divergens TaxID=32595 RepID=A0AAD9G6I6_BABDI|nr:hypothetical protein X943_000617 [Babesia divergens]
MSSQQKPANGKDDAKNASSGITLFDVAVLVMACSLYMPDQTTSVASKHLTVCLDLPAENTGLYFTKLYASKTLTNFLGSTIMLIIQLSAPTYTTILSIISIVFMLIVRVLVVIAFYTSDAAVNLYNALIMQALFQGMFQSTFYPVAAEKMSVLSLAFKLSKIVLWFVQIIMDIVIRERATWMISVHLSIMLCLSVTGSLTWVISCFSKISDSGKPALASDSKPGTTAGAKDGQLCPSGNPPKPTDPQKPAKKQNDDDSWLKIVCIRLLGNRMPHIKEKRCEKGCCDLDEPFSKKPDLTFWDVVKRVYSPFLMCAIGWPFRTFYQPGILPYALVDRSLCHPIIITNMFFSFILTFIIHFMKQGFKSMSKPWGKAPYGWHMIWFAMVPPILCIPFIHTTLHYPESIMFRMLRNNRINTGILMLVLSTGTTLISSMGYIGVSACSKVEGQPRGPNSIRFTSLNALVAQLFASIAYRLSTGYLILRRKYVDDICNAAPTDHLSWFGKMSFWVGKTLTHAWNDFIHEFDGNVRHYATSSIKAEI